MKSIFIYILLIAGLLVACSDDFLEREPKDAISDSSFWTTENDLKLYANGFYGSVPSYRGWGSKYSVENGSDNALGIKEMTFPDGKIFRTNSDAGNNSNTWNDIFRWLRSINYMIGNLEKYDMSALSEDGKHYVGEAYFFRAYHNYRLLSTFGDAPFIDAVPNLDDVDLLYKERMPRYDFAMKIMEDLDMAIANLKTIDNVDKGRISKEAALGYKSRYALFEGSWEYYHQNTDYGVNGKDGRDFLQLAVGASNQVITKLGGNVFKGSSGKEYWELFNQKDYSTIAGVLHYQVYNKEEGIAHVWANYAGGGGQIGLTKAAVDDYLMANGEPKEINTGDYQGDDDFAALIANRDPRLAQTIYTKEKWGTFDNLSAIPEQNNIEMAAVTSKAWYYAPPTGLMFAKGIRPDRTEYTDRGWGEAGWIHLRYAEVLLANIEAKAILEGLGQGSVSQQDIDNTINVLRDRVNMGHLTLANISAWSGDANYFNRYGNVPALINEIRRERRIEFIGEGYRYDDLRRWRMLGHLIRGNVPRGAKAQQFLDYWGPQGKLEPGDITVDSQGYLLPGGFRSDFGEGGAGYQIDEGRDYLWPVPKGQIDLYKSEADVVLTQNPGWI
ncbi:MAG: RagB/SusD family nutrient uptake outer membrane protein [Carboxylicivirga sp.]|jgi:hypothetical protein|nr:RagB/SusD family nutrient uptake outer membrane protein [Carboxylicivirga sp.]MCT4643691.1 RagB/SusD family nutrient uptake outer membrane protein [Carboxylicivirga sp.]